MSDVTTLEPEILNAIAGATDERRSKRCASARWARAARSRVAQTLGGMTPDEHKAQGPLINGLRTADGRDG